MSKKKLVGAVAGLALLALGVPAHADESAMGPNAPKIFTTYGASFNVGGGVVGFTDGDMRDFANVGGAWDARFVFGTRADVAIEAAYTGGAVSVDALGLDDDAALISTGAEVLARVNFLKKEWQPYIVAGVGWRHYSIVNSDENTSSVQDAEDLGEIPMGIGLSYRYRGLVVDGRGLFRAAFNDDMIVTRPTESDPSLSNWQAQVTAGYEF